jgi:hypothetical protein
MLTRLVSRFATTSNKTYGKLKDSDRIFTNVYKDTDPYINGALRRVSISRYREIGIVQRTFSLMGLIGLSIKLNCQDFEDEEEQVFHQV